MNLEIRSNGKVFIAGTKGSPVANSPFSAKGILKEAGFWWHGGPCKPGCLACENKVPKMWWTADPAKAARLKTYCNEAALKAIAPILVLKEKSSAIHSDFFVPCPEGLAYDGFQVAGIEFVTHAWETYKGALIADEMGLGKTVQALGLMRWLEEEPCGPETVTCAVFCPQSLVLNWKREAEKWLGKTWQVLTHEDYFNAEEPPLWGIANVLIIWPYSQVEKFPKMIVQDTGVPPYVNESPLELDLLAFDEAHYIKNPEAKRTQACIECFSKGKPVKGSGRIAAQARKLLFLTGTPILNRPLELQTLLSAIDPSFNGFWFLKKFCGAHKDSQGHWDFSGATNLEEMQDTLRTKFMVRRLKKYVYKDLPPKRRSLIPLELNSSAKAAIKGGEPKFEDCVANMEAKKPWGHPAQVRQQLAIAKVDKAVEFVKDLLENTEKVIVFGFTLDSMKQIVNELVNANIKADLIIGETPLATREMLVQDFQKGDLRVIVGGYGPMGVGLTLTASSTVVMTEPAWTPAEVSQAEDRAHRRGQTEMVNCYHLVWDGTLEAKMMKMIVTKQDIADRALDRSTEIKLNEDVAKVLREGEDEYRVRVLDQPPLYVFTPEERSLIHRALKFLAGRCDGAVGVDGAGFNKLDSSFGKSLAAAGVLSDKQAFHGKKLIKKYRSQLEAGGISLAALEGI